MSDIQKRVKDLVGKGKIKDALKLLSEYAATTNDKDLENEVILLKARHTTLEKDLRIGIISSTNANLESSKIINAIITIQFNIVSSSSSTTQPSETPQSEHLTNSDNLKTILFLASSPTDLAQLQLEREFAQISNKIQNHHESYRLVSEWAITAEKLINAIQDHNPDIIHFSGHGEVEKINEGGIYLQNSLGQSNLVNTASLQRFFERLSQNNINIQLVVLNSCFSTAQAEAIKPSVTNVIGMNDAIEDETAIQFSAMFYRNLVGSQNTQMAFDMAISLLEMEGLFGEDIPELL